MDALWFFIGVAIFVVIAAVATQRWWPRLAMVSPTTRFVLVMTTVGGLVGAFFWWQDVEPSFAWDLPPLASRLLGAAATAFGLAGLTIAERPSPARAWLHMVSTAIYIVPLTLAVLALHLDRFNFSRPVTYGFFSAVTAVGLGALLALREGRPAGGATRKPPAAVAAFLTIAGIVLALWGVALFLAPATPWPLVFVWPGDPLTSRLIASMLLTLGAAFLLAREDAALAPVSQVMGAAYGFGVLVACLVNWLGGKPVPTLYASAFAIVALGCIAGLISRRTRRPA